MLKDQLNKLKPKSKILIIAGSDSSGGAGVQADIKTVTSLGSYALTAITAVTIQNTLGVKSVISLPLNDIKDQIIYTAKDIKPDAIKIGMLHSKNVIKKVLEALKILKIKKTVLDPVMVAKGGARLINKSAIEILRKDLIKKVYLVTPNIPEAEVLVNMKINNKEDMILAANRLISYGAKNVLIKGGHLNTEKVDDVFLNRSDFKIFTSKRFKTKNTHGTGCTLSSAVATFFSCGKSIKKACELGIKYVNSGIKTNPNYGKGHGPINHLNSIKINKRFK